MFEQINSMAVCFYKMTSIMEQHISSVTNLFSVTIQILALSSDMIQKKIDTRCDNFVRIGVV